MTAQSRFSQPHALTLVELVLSMAIMVLLVSGLTSAVVIAGHALPSRQDEVNVVVRAQAAADQIAEELSCAITLTDATATAITFTVADRNEDAAADTIRYAWSGTAGDALTRQYNAGSLVNVAEDVQVFELTYGGAGGSGGGGGGGGGGDTLLISHTESGGSLTTAGVYSYQSLAECFLPTLSGDAESWELTRVRFKARQEGAVDGEFSVQVRTAGGDFLPTDTVLEEVSVSESSLSTSVDWYEVSFSTLSGLAPLDIYAVVFEHVAGDCAARLEYEYYGVDTSNAYLAYTSGGSWMIYPPADLIFEVYGIVTLLDGSEAEGDSGCDSIGLSFTVGDGNTRIETSIPLLNAPEVPGV